MRWPVALIAVLLALVLTPRASCCSPQWSSVGEEKNKRWSSIPTAQDATPDQPRPWPRSEEGGPALVTFCFSNQESLSKLHAVFFDALLKWGPTLRASSLKVVSDPACPTKHECLCSIQDVAPSTLQIELGTENWATVGFRDSVTATGDRDEKRERNVLQFALTNHKYLDILSMAHEIGHVFGLLHEHQRPDAGRFVQFNCKALPSYNEAKAKVSAAVDKAEPALAAVNTIDDKMEKVCSSIELARKYFKEAARWMPNPAYQSCSRSEAYDFDSIMSYSSFAGHAVNGLYQYPLLRHKRDLSHGEPTDLTNLIWRGGSRDLRLARPSDMDMNRVTALYPKDSGSVDSKPGRATDEVKTRRRSRRALLAKKRWNSLPTAQEGRREDGVVPWPASKETGLSEVHFCFIDQRSLSKLYPVLMGALLKWTPAIRESSLRIMPSPACTKEDECLCIPGVRPLALRIELGQRDQATLGFRDPMGAPPKGDHRRRNTLSYDPQGDLARDIVGMAHEIGHVMGLLHEHQRPDAGQYISFDCSALPGYEEVKQLVSKFGKSDSRFPATMSLEQKMHKVCSEPELAEYYHFGQATNYMPRHTEEEYHHSRAYDFHSIMNYDSEIEVGDGETKYPLLRHKRDLSDGSAPTDAKNLLYEGGNKDPRLAGPSQMDIDRVKALYPKKPQSVEKSSPSGAPDKPPTRRKGRRALFASSRSEAEHDGDPEQSG